MIFFQNQFFRNFINIFFVVWIYVEIILEMKIPQKDSLIKYNHYYFIINIYMVKKKTKSVERVKKKK